MPPIQVTVVAPMLDGGWQTQQPLNTEGGDSEANPSLMLRSLAATCAKTAGMGEPKPPDPVRHYVGIRSQIIDTKIDASFEDFGRSIAMQRG